MGELERLIQAYRSRASASTGYKLDLLMDIQRIPDPRVVPFLIQTLTDREEREGVRVHVLKQLQNGGRLVAPIDRPVIARAITQVLADHSPADLRVQAALSLGEFVDIDGVLSTVNDVCLAKNESIDLRYAASLERAGPTPECIALLRHMSSDDTLGRSARSVLSAWHVE